MALTITGYATDIQGNASANGTVVVAAANPSAFFQEGGNWAQLTPIYKWLPTDSTGHFSWTVPWTAQDPSNTQVTITMPSGVQWAGVLPLAYNGTLDLHDLKNAYSWGIASPPIVPVNVVSGQGFNWRGTWSSANTYAPYDVAYYNGSSYQCILARSATATTPDADTTHWSLMAQSGASVASGFDLTAMCRAFLAR